MYEIPVYHPVIVHFPIALLTLAGLAGAVWMFYGDSFWRRVTALLLFFGFLGTVAARISGETMKRLTQHSPLVQEFVERHESLSLWTLILSGAALLLLGGYTLWTQRRRRRGRHVGLWDPIGLRIIGAALAVLAAVWVLRTGKLGGIMVWGDLPTDVIQIEEPEPEMQGPPEFIGPLEE